MLLVLLMLLYEKTESENMRVAETNKGKLMLFFKIMPCAIVKNWISSKSKKPEEY